MTDIMKETVSMAEMHPPPHPLERIATALEAIVAHQRQVAEKAEEDAKEFDANWKAQNAMIHDNVEANAAYLRQVRERMDREDVHRMTCAQCKAHYGPGEMKGN